MSFLIRLNISSFLYAWFPIMNPADKPNPVTGLIAIAVLGLYPFYLAIVHLFGTGVSGSERSGL